MLIKLQADNEQMVNEKTQSEKLHLSIPVSVHWSLDWKRTEGNSLWGRERKRKSKRESGMRGIKGHTGQVEGERKRATKLNRENFPFSTSSPFWIRLLPLSLSPSVSGSFFSCFNERIEGEREKLRERKSDVGDLILTLELIQGAWNLTNSLFSKCKRSGEQKRKKKGRREKEKRERDKNGGREETRNLFKLLPFLLPKTFCELHPHPLVSNSLSSVCWMLEVICD